MWFLTGQVQIDGSPVKVQLVDTAGQVWMPLHLNQEFHLRLTQNTKLFTDETLLNLMI